MLRIGGLNCEASLAVIGVFRIKEAVRFLTTAHSSVPPLAI